MLIINSILGNVYKDSQLAKKIEEEKQRGKFRHIELSRTEMEKSRLRKKTADGLDVGFVLEPGTKLNHGDVISKSDEIILTAVSDTPSTSEASVLRIRCGNWVAQ